VKGIQHPDDARLAIDNGADVIYVTNHGGRQANSGISTLELLPGVAAAAGSTPTPTPRPSPPRPRSVTARASPTR
jgi:lactate 2-monooxygenase